MKYLLLVFSLSICFPAFAQQDIEGSSDHPLLTRYPGAYIASYDQEKYREYSFATGPITGYRQIAEKRMVSGQIYRITYLIDQPVAELSIGEVYQDYVQAIQQAGITIEGKGLFSNRNVAKQVGGGSWIGTAMKDNRFPQNSKANLLFAGTSSSGGTFAIMGQLKSPNATTNLAIYGERHSNKLVVVHVDIIEEKAADLGYVFADADYIRRELDAKGVVSIYGINFDFDSAVIKADSKPVLDEVAAFLKSEPQIALYVVGHTDMKGSLTYNLSLSKQRAQAVVEKLAGDYGIEKARFQADGVGPLAPKGTNETEEGRALNRRVELVKRITDW